MDNNILNAIKAFREKTKAKTEYVWKYIQHNIALFIHTHIHTGKKLKHLLLN